MGYLDIVAFSCQPQMMTSGGHVTGAYVITLHGASNFCKEYADEG